MALISLFFTTRAKLGALELDASLQETHEASATLTQSEVEDGATISDNVILLPRKLTLEGFVSKTPLGVAGLIGSAGSALGGLAGTAAAKAGGSKLQTALATAGVASVGGLIASSVSNALTDGPKSREPKDVWDYLDELRTLRLPFTVITALKTYDNMIVTNITGPRNKDNVGGMRFTATLEQVKIVTAQVVSAASAIPGAAAAQDLGKQAAGSADASTGSNASLLYHGFSAAGLL